MVIAFDSGLSEHADVGSRTIRNQVEVFLEFFINHRTYLSFDVFVVLLDKLDSFLWLLVVDFVLETFIDLFVNAGTELGIVNVFGL